MSSLKLNLSDNRIDQINEFRQNFPSLTLNKEDQFPVIQYTKYPRSSLSSTVFELRHIQKILYDKLIPGNKIPKETNADVTPELLRHVQTLKSLDTISQTSLELANYFSEESDDEIEKLSKPVDIIGFEDNTSANNLIIVLFRFCLEEITVSMSHSTDEGERPYIMCTATRFLVESAIMEYGPAIQITLGSIYLVDKYHHYPSGEYLEILSTEQGKNVLAIMYRKVFANCPDFKSHFHSCEQSFVIDISTVNLVWLRSAVIIFLNYLSDCKTKLQWLQKYILYFYELLVDSKSKFIDKEDPPVPSGATKWSLSGNLQKITLKLCDTEADLFLLKLSGFQSGCVFKANDKIIFRAALSDFILEDLIETTLYNKIIEVEDDKVFEIKFVKFNPCFGDLNKVSIDEITCKSDFSLSIHVGHLQCVFLFKVYYSILRLFESVFSKDLLTEIYNYSTNIAYTAWHQLLKNKISLSLQIHIPTLLIPQKSDSPCLLVFNFGDFKADNFFKLVSALTPGCGTIENILLEIGPLEISRAVMALTGGMELQEAILEPTLIRIDLKRSLMRPCRDVLSWDMSVNVDALYVNLSQRDLNTIICITEQNISEALPEKNLCSRPTTPVESEIPVNCEDSVGKLQDFLNHSVDIYRTSIAAIFVESIKVSLYSDMNEILSSPVRDAATALCKLEVGEIQINGDMNNDKSIELKATIHSFDIYDVRMESSNCIKNIFGQFPVKETIVQNKFQFNQPPLLDVMIKISPNGDLNTEISLDRVRLNLSVGFVLALGKYINNSLPRDTHFDEDAFNQYYFDGQNTDIMHELKKPSSSSCSTSGYLSTATYGYDGKRVISISFKAKLPEVVFHIDPEEPESRIFVARSHIQCDYSKHPGNESLKVNFDKVSIFASVYSNEKHSYYVILPPSYIETTWNICKFETETIAINTSDIKINLCLNVIQMINDIIEEIKESQILQSTVDFELPISEKEDLWSTKTLHTKYITSESTNEDFTFDKYDGKNYQQKLIIKTCNVEILFDKGYVNICPVFKLKMTLSGELCDWSKAMFFQASIPVSMLYFNEEFSSWEYILDPITDNASHPIEFQVRSFQHLRQPIGPKFDHDHKTECSACMWPLFDKKESKDSFHQNSDSSSEEEYGTSEMVILKPLFKSNQDTLRRGYSFESDSESEGNLLYKISSTFSHLFSSGSDISEEENGNSDDDDAKDALKGGNAVPPKDGLKTDEDNYSGDRIPVTVSDDDSLTKEHKSIMTAKFLLATSIIVSCREALNFSISANVAKSFCQLWYDFHNFKSDSSHVFRNESEVKKFKLKNEIGPNSKITLMSVKNTESSNIVKVIAESTFQERNLNFSRHECSMEEYSSEDSAEENISDHVSVSKCENLDTSVSFSEKKNEIPSSSDGFSLQIPDCVNLYDDITKFRIKIEVDDFETLEVFVGTKTQNRIFQLHHRTSDCRYYIVVLLEILNQTVNVTVRSPLQVTNDISFPVNICFKKSALQNLPIEKNDKDASSPSLSIASFGSLSNPFADYPSMVTLQPDQYFSIPLLIAYHSPIYVVPSATDYNVSEDGIWWKELDTAGDAKVLTCSHKNEEGDPVAINCLLTNGVSLRSPNEENISHMVPNYLLRLSPHTRLYNYLPYTLILQQLSNSLPITLDPGGSTTLSKLDPHKDKNIDIQVCNYQGSDWKGTLRIPNEMSDFSRTISLTRIEEQHKGKLELSIHVTKDATTSVYIYSPYWIVNKTGLPIKVKGSKHKRIIESSGNEEILLFDFKKNYPHKLKICVLESDWSRGWCCDAVGTCGVVICEDKVRNKKYRVVSKHSLSTLKEDLQNTTPRGIVRGIYHPTKIISLMPYLLVKNLTSKAIMYMQENDKNGLWFDIGPNQCETFWPTCEDMYLVVRRRDSQVISQRFHFNSIHKTVLRMEKGTALVVKVDGVGSDSPVMITFSNYVNGDAPIRLENGCDNIYLRFHQKGSNQVTVLAPQQSILYTWDDPTLERELLWNVYGSKSKDFTAIFNMDKHDWEKVKVNTKKMTADFENGKDAAKIRPKKTRQTKLSNNSEEDDETDFSEDDFVVVGKEFKQSIKRKNKNAGKTSRTEVIIHWVCYKQKNQRVLFFAPSDNIAHFYRKGNEFANIECFVSLESVSLSVITNEKKELIYGGIYPSVSSWQIEVDGVWKELQSLELCTWLEDQYCFNKNNKVNLKCSLQVDFQKMLMITPFIGRLRRLKHPALWIHLRQSSRVSYYRIRINAIQIDNQMEDANFPIILSSNRYDTTDQPSIDFCLVVNKTPKCGRRTVRHVDIITQEMNLNLEKQLIVSVCNIISPIINSFNKLSIRSELKELLTPCTFSAFEVIDTLDTSCQVERVCFGGLTLKISFSFKGLNTIASKLEKFDILDGYLSSIGINLREIQNVAIKVSHIELEAVSLNQVVSELENHFKHQLIQQIYVLILGVDILANPYQRLRALTKAVRSVVYNAEKGIVARPDDFADEIANECYCFCGHSNCCTNELKILNSAVDVVAKNMCIQQRKKGIQGYSTTKPYSFTDEIPSHWLLPIGLIWHLRGRLHDAYSETSQESVEHFLRNKGKGLIGLISNSSCFGINNPISVLEEGIWRSILQGYQAVFRVNSPRHVALFSSMKPRNNHEIEGLSILSMLPRSTHACAAEKYFAHVVLRNTKHPPIFLATMSHFYFLESYGHWGHCKIVWKILIRDLKKQPLINADTITFQLRQDEVQCHLSGAVKLLQSNSTAILDFVMNIVKSAMTLQMEEIPCPTYRDV